MIHSVTTHSPRKRSQILLLPAQGWFIGLTIMIALIWQMAPLGRLLWLPNILVLVFLFWNIHQPHLIGIGTGFTLGFLIDVQHGILLGQNALAFTLLSFIVLLAHHRILWFNLVGQAVHVGVLCCIYSICLLLINLFAGKSYIEWSVLWVYLLSPVLSALLWPLISILLLAPQRRAPDPDDTRALTL